MEKNKNNNKINKTQKNRPRPSQKGTGRLQQPT